MSKYKLMCLDLDGTLLTGKRRISPRTKDAIAKAERHGVSAVVTTGRPLFDAAARAREIQDHGYVIASNGAAIGKLDAGEPAFSTPFSESETKYLMELSRAQDLNATWFTAKAIYTRGAKTRRLYRIIEMTEGKSLRGRVFPEEEMNCADVHKCNFFFLERNEERRIFEQLRNDGRFELVFTGHRRAEITARGVTKASGIKALAQMAGILPDQIIAIGDSENDIEMIKYAGLGIAMSNAIPALKNESKWITGSNNEDGIVDVIERFILNG